MISRNSMESTQSTDDLSWGRGSSTESLDEFDTEARTSLREKYLLSRPRTSALPEVKAPVVEKRTRRKKRIIEAECVVLKPAPVIRQSSAPTEGTAEDSASRNSRSLSPKRAFLSRQDAQQTLTRNRKLFGRAPKMTYDETSCVHLVDAMGDYRNKSL